MAGEISGAVSPICLHGNTALAGLPEQIGQFSPTLLSQRHDLTICLQNFIQQLPVMDVCSFPNVPEYLIQKRPTKRFDIHRFFPGLRTGAIQQLLRQCADLGDAIIVHHIHTARCR